MSRSVIIRSTAFAVTATAVGIASLFTGAGAASAAPVASACGPDGTLLAGNVCEQKFTTVGNSTFTPTAQISTLQVLLVGGGGSGASNTSTGYGAAGGGGGAVKVVDFTGDTATALNITVGTGGVASSVAEGTAVAQVAAAGTSGSGGSTTFAIPTVAGTSGTGKAGFVAGLSASGGGAAASPTSVYAGGAGDVVSAVAPANSLFSNDSDCFGGGGPSSDGNGGVGSAQCGSGDIAAVTFATVAPAPNTGGGGAGSTVSTSGVTEGATGLVVVRWIPTLTLSLTSNGVTTTQTVAYGAAPVKPADPTKKGFVFKGWFTDAAFTTEADFSDPITASTTFYAAFSPLLATTGGGFSPWEAPLGVTGLGAGLVLALIAARRSRRAI